MLAVAALFMSLSEHHQQFFYLHFWTHLLVANIIGLSLSFYFYWVGGVEPFARCVTKDQVIRWEREGGEVELKLKRPLTRSEPVSEMMRFFLGIYYSLANYFYLK